MTNMQRASRTGGANGPGADKAKENTAKGDDLTPEKIAHLMSFDEVPDFSGETDKKLEMSTLEDDLNPQERRGLGTETSVITDRYPNFTPNMTEDGPNLSPNENPFALYDSLPFEENPKNLPYVPNRDGFKNAWIRWFNEDGSYDRELQQMLRRGYRPVDPANVASAQRAFIQTRPNGFGGDCLCVSGMVLCEILETLWQRHQENESNQHRKNERAVLNPIRDANEAAAKRGARGMVIGVEETDE